jgi:hypothetical protein
VAENKVFRKMFIQGTEITGEWKTTYNEKIHNLMK